MPYCDDFWHIDAHGNILSPACLTVFVKSKTENQLVAASRVPRDLDSDTGRGWKRPRVEVVTQSV